MNGSTNWRTPISKVWKDRSQLLEGLTPSERESILNASTPRQFTANSVVFNQGSPANKLFLLTIGRARNFFITEDGRKILLNWLIPGDIFGADTGLAKPAYYLFGTETVKDSDVLVWDRHTIRGLAARHPRLLDNGLLIAARYFMWFLAAHEALTCHLAPRRLAQVLVRLAKGIGREVSDGFELDVTNEELAHSANVTLFTVSRLMSQWQRQGAVAKGRGTVLLRSPERLFEAKPGCEPAIRNRTMRAQSAAKLTKVPSRSRRTHHGDGRIGLPTEHIPEHLADPSLIVPDKRSSYQ